MPSDTATSPARFERWPMHSMAAARRADHRALEIAVARAERLRVLFLCTGNSCRSQMAEGFARARWADSIDAHSAGTDPHGMNRLAVRAMAEVGVDIARNESKKVGALGPRPFDFVITVC